ncbi:MAG: biotin--[acetyl-CoA-carboxylase] ligase [Bacteroidota bacterium]|nr:biotin--[acetyl-CoA-carboxylase] ligase [Candidatus Kapabacteria bacterium]MDW8221093.1 biotin--[acetyl-CoA-carboxylase] ligase [Bacteroidota bacterium]
MRPLRRYHFSEVSSTNDVAQELIARCAENEYIAVTADSQTAGRGRNGRIWHSEPCQNLYCSFAIRYAKSVKKNTAELAAYQARGALAALYAIRSFLPPFLHDHLLLKYPNDVLMVDVMHTRKKVCGVLVEHEFLGVRCLSTVIGIGINVRQTLFPPELCTTATSLLLCGLDVTVEDVVQELLRVWEEIAGMPIETIWRLWWQELHLEGVSIALYNSSEEWFAQELNSDGMLVLKNVRGERRVLMHGESLRRIDWKQR